MIQFNIDSGSPVSDYQQVIRAVKLEILSGGLKDGDRLHLIQDLAKTLNLNPNTVAKAYYNLGEEGLVECKGRRGSWIRYKNIRQDRLRKIIAEDEFKVFWRKHSP